VTRGWKDDGGRVWEAGVGSWEIEDDFNLKDQTDQNGNGWCNDREG